MLIQIIQNVKLHTETWITPFFILPHKLCLPLVSSVFTWSCKGMVLSCIKDKTLLGMAGFSLSNKKSVACIHYYKISFISHFPGFFLSFWILILIAQKWDPPHERGYFLTLVPGQSRAWVPGGIPRPVTGTPTTHYPSQHTVEVSQLQLSHSSRNISAGLWVNRYILQCNSQEATEVIDQQQWYILTSHSIYMNPSPFFHL